MSLPTSSSSRSRSARPFRFRVALLLLGVALVCVLVLGAIFISPLFSTPTTMIRANRVLYDRAIQDIAAATIPGGSPNGDLVTLPKQYLLLSPGKNGEVIIYRTDSMLRVLFYPRPAGAQTWVYLYASDNTPIELAGECAGIQRERENWFLFHCP